MERNWMWILYETALERFIHRTISEYGDKDEDNSSNNVNSVHNT